MTRMYRSTDALRYVVMKDLARLPIDPVGSACQVGRDDIALVVPAADGGTVYSLDFSLLLLVGA